jgi:hypothetical protein
MLLRKHSLHDGIGVLPVLAIMLILLDTTSSGKLWNHLMADANNFVGKQIKILLPAAMVRDCDTQAVPSLQGRVGWSRDSLLVELNINILV